MTRENRSILFLMSFLLLLPVVAVFSVISGATDLGASEFINWLFYKIGLINFKASGISEQQILIIESIRLPRTVLGIIVGSTLSLCGAAMQGLFRNSLADPGIIGVSSGAALGAGTVIVLGVGELALGFEWLQSYGVSLAAFLGGFIATLLVYKIGSSTQGTSVSAMLLAGIAISALSAAGIGLLNYVATDSLLRTLTFWQMGSLATGQWIDIFAAITLLVPVHILLLAKAKCLNALLLGESEARYLGYDIQKEKRWLILLTALGVGIAVSLAGMIGFVGLVVPHLVRLLIGPDHKFLLPGACLLGAAMLLCADVIARTIVSPAELPIGIVTALLGAPFFLSILWQQRKRMIA